jgi:hypothetical protein
MAFEPAPVRDAVVDLAELQPKWKPVMNVGLLTRPWHIWIDLLRAKILTVPVVVGRYSGSSVAVNLAAVTVPTSTLRTGLYRVSFYVRVTKLGVLGSTVVVSFGWTDGGESCSRDGSAGFGVDVSLATTDTGTLLLRADGKTAITVTTTGVLAGCLYDLEVVVEEMP